jgi:hypothetical protein
LPDKGGCFEPYLVGVLASSKLGYDGDAAYEAQILLNLDIVQNDLLPVSGYNGTSSEAYLQR